MPPPKALRLSKTGEEKIIRAIREEWEAFTRARAHRRADGTIAYTERLLEDLGQEGLATLRYLARRGDREAARLLVERLLGQPEQPYSVRIANLSLAEAEEFLRRELLAANLSKETAEALVTRIEEVSALPAVMEDTDEGIER